MKRRYIHLTLWGIFTMLVLLMAGCGTNVLKGLASEPEVTNAANILKFAETKEDFEKAEDAADKILSSSTNSEEMQEAYITKGEAILGANGVTPVDIFANVGSLATAGESSSDNENLFNLISTEATSSTLASAAESLNNATSESALSKNVSSSSLRVSEVPALKEGDYLIIGIANTLVVVSVVQDVLNIAANGAAELKTGEDWYQGLKDLLQPTAFSALTETTTLGYATAAITAFTNAAVFTDEQSSQLNKVQETMSMIDDLYKAVVGESSVTIGSNSYDFANISSDDRNTKIQEALGAVFTAITS